MARDHLPRRGPPSLPTTSPPPTTQHADLGRWLDDHAPADVTDQLAAASWNRDQRSPGRRPGVRGADREDLADTGGSPAASQRLGRPPPGRDHHAGRRLEGTIRRYEYRLGQAATYTCPEHVTDLLGPLPERVTEAERWQAAAGAIEAYRTRWNIAGHGHRSVLSRPTPSNVATGAPLWQLWARQDSSRTKDLTRPHRSEGVWRHAGRPCGPRTGRGRPTGCGTTTKGSSPSTSGALADAELATSIVAVTPASGCEPRHCRCPSSRPRED